MIMSLMFIMIAGCGRALSHADVAALIAASPQLQEHRLTVGNAVAREPAVAGRHLFPISAREPDEIDRTLTAAGYLHMTPVSIPGYGNRLRNIELTARGAAANVATMAGQYQFVYAMPDILNVTAVSTENERSVADFTWRYRYEEWSKDLWIVKQLTARNPPHVGHGRARLRRFDDGWHVEEVELN